MTGRGRHLHRSLAGLVVFVGSIAVAASARAADYQPPQLRAPERGSVAGEYAAVAFRAGELDRGDYRLPGAFQLPDDRGAVGADVLPAYSTRAGVSEYGVGWSTSLELHRFRVAGDLDYATDDLVGPWGRLVRASDGYLYPLGMAQLVRVQESAATITAWLPDGSIWTFGGSAVVATARGVYAWYLTDVVTPTGRSTHLSWSAGAGRQYLTSVEYGGVGSDRQYQVAFAYESTPSLFVSYASGEPATLDRRVRTITVSARHAQSRAFTERYHYSLDYDVDPWGPAFYLAAVTRTYRSGESSPTVRYGYRRASDWLEQAAFTPAPSVTQLLQTFGADGFQHDRATLFDADDDGRVDLESASTQMLARRTDAGFALESLPANSGAYGGCRRDPSPYNPPRALVKLSATDAAYHVLDLEADGGMANTTVSVCDRDGTLQTQLSVEGDWEPGPVVRVADLNRDHAPDVVRVGYGYFAVLPNISDAGGVRFDTPRYGTLSPAFEPAASWVYDFNGDGLPDMVARDSSNLFVWFGLGGYQFTSEAQLFPLTSDLGPLWSLDGFDVEFLDANHDGLTDVVLSQAGTFYLYVNDGFELRYRPLAAFSWLGGNDSTPVFADLAGTGDAALNVSRLGEAWTLPLEQPGTGLLVSVDDGEGTALALDYARGPAAPGAHQRDVVLAALTVTSSGYDAITYAYSYSGPRADSVGHFLIGFDQVARVEPNATITQSFLNEDDVAGIELDESEHDRLAPDVGSFESRSYRAATFHGVRWMQPASLRRGFSDGNGAHTVERRTDYVTWDADFCPATTRETDAHGTLTVERTRDTPAALASSLHCLSAIEVKSGKHADARLDFRHEEHIERNAVGLPVTMSSWGAAGQLVTQRRTYNPDWTLATVSSPARGTSTFTWNGGTHLLDRVVDYDGSATTIAERDPVDDGIRQLTTAHGTSVLSQWFRFDGQERLARSWDNLGQANETTPDRTLSYRYATATQPASIRMRSLIDAATGSARQTAELMTAAGEPIASVQLGGQGWVFDRVTSRARARGETTAVMRPSLAAAGDPTTLDYATLLGGATSVAVSHAAPLMGDIDRVERFHADVSRATRATLAVSGGSLVRSELENETLPMHDALDEERRVIEHDDQAGARWTYGYDVLGRVRAVALPDGTVHRLDVDDYGRDARVVRDGIGSVEYEYDPTRGLLSETRHFGTDGALLRAVDITYDDAGRKIVESHSDAHGGSVVFQYYYDGATPSRPLDRSTPGWLTAVAGDGYTKELEHRPDGKISRQVFRIDGWRSVETSWRYSEEGMARGHTTTVRAANGTALATTVIDDGYDAFGRVTSIALGGATLATLGYDNNDLVANVALPGGSVQLSYDGLTRKLVGTRQSTAEWIAEDAWKLDARGMVGSELLSAGNVSAQRSYAYSAARTLTRSTDPFVDYQYDYDATGLSTRIHDGRGDRLLVRSGDTLTAGNVEYRFDAGGRTVSRDALQLRYGADGQVAEAHRGGAAWRFKYDENGHRILKLAGDGTPLAAYPPEGYLDASGLTEALRVGTTTIGVVTGGVFRMVPIDHRGTTLGDSDGTARLPSPYGDRAQHGDLAAAIDYIEHGWDADLGVVRLGVRDYDPSIGRFLTPDPRFLAHPAECVRSPIECNLYAYSADDPLGHTDPSGEVAVADDIAEALIGAVILTGIYIALPKDQRSLSRAAEVLKDDIDGASNWMAAANDTAKVYVAAKAVALARRFEIGYVFATYTVKLADGSTYSGRTSAVVRANETVDQAAERAVDQRWSTHHMRAFAAPGAVARLDAYLGSKTVDSLITTYYMGMRGREQQDIDVNGGARSDGGTSGNAIRGVAKDNPLRSYFEAAADAFVTPQFGPPMKQ